MKKTLIALVAALMTLGAFADTETVDGVTWTYTITDGCASVGGGSPNATAIPVLTTGEVTIPSILGGCAVTNIEDYAFYGCCGITCVIIPDGVKSIGNYSFSGCAGLTNVTIPDSVKNVGEYAFEGCSSLKEAFAPESLKWLSESTFLNCAADFHLSYYEWSYGYINGFDEIEICKRWGDEPAISPMPTGVVIIPSELHGRPVTCIGERAFESEYWHNPWLSQNEMTRVIVPDSVRNICNDAFYGCTGLVSVAIGNGVTNIGYSAFAHCENLPSIAIPNSVRNLDTWAFGYCYALTNVMISAGVTNIGTAPFGACKKLMSIEVADDNPAYASVDGLLMTKDGKTLIQGVNRELVIPDSVENIGGCAFFLCEALTSMTIPASVNNIESGAFVGCFGLKKFDVDADNSSYKAVSGLLLTKDGKTLVAVPGGAMDLTIPSGVKSIGDCAVYTCTNLVSVTIPKGVEVIGEGAFGECINLKRITIPNSVKSIGEYAFEFCKSLTSVTVPASVKGIGNEAFSVCRNLITLYLPRALKGKVGKIFSRYGSDATIDTTIIYYNDGSPEMLTITFDPNGGNLADESDAAREVMKGVAISVLPEPKLDDYVFIGWFTAAQGGTMVTASTKLSKDIVCYAHWQYLGDADDSTIVYELDESYDTEEDGSFALDLFRKIGSTSELKISVKGLPSGVKYDSKSMTISGKAAKPGVYTVTVSATNKTVKNPVTVTFDLVVPNLMCDVLPELRPETDAYGTVQCGVAFDTGLINCTPEDGWSVKAAGLPAGLKLVQDKTTGAYSITGVPTKAGTYTVTFTASKKGEKNQISTITLTTEALPLWATGTFTGYVRGDEGNEANFDAYGPATMTVTANGALSGKFTLLGTNWTFSAASFVECGLDYFKVATTAKAGKATMPVEIGFWHSEDPESDGVALVDASCEGWCGDPSKTVINLWRNIWKDKETAALAKEEIAKWEGVYTISVEDGGYFSLMVTKTGDVRVSGKLADGTALSATVPLNYQLCNDFFAFVCVSPSAYKGGFVWLPIGFGTNRGPLGDLGHGLILRDRNPLSTYDYGSGSYSWLSFTGAYYDKTQKLNDYYGSLRFATDAPELAYSFKRTYLNDDRRKITETEAWTANAVDTLSQEGLTVAVGDKGFVVAKATRPVQDKETKEWSYDGANDGALALSFTQATGIFRGSYTFWYDYASAYDDTKPDGQEEIFAHTLRRVNFEGIWVQGADHLRGFYLWDMPSSYVDPKTGKNKTYKYKESHRITLAP